MPDFTNSNWDSFKEQFFSVIRFVFYCFDVLFDTCRSNPMLYAFFFFPIFAVAFLLVLEFILRLAPESSGLINSKQVKGVLTSAKVSSKAYGKASASINKQNIAAKKAANDASRHAAMVNKLNASGRGSDKYRNINPSDVKGGRNAEPSKQLNGVKGNGSSFGTVSGSSISYNTGLGEIASHGEGKRLTGVGSGGINAGSSNAVKNLYQGVESERKHRAAEARAEEKSQAEDDMNFNTQTDYYYSTDDDGNRVTTTVRTNTRTGEVVSKSDSVRHTNK